MVPATIDSSAKTQKSGTLIDIIVINIVYVPVTTRQQLPAVRDRERRPAGQQEGREPAGCGGGPARRVREGHPGPAVRPGTGRGHGVRLLHPQGGGRQGGARRPGGEGKGHQDHQQAGEPRGGPQVGRTHDHHHTLNVDGTVSIRGGNSMVLGD